MMLSTKARYAVMAMTDLARTGDGSPVCLADIAERQEVTQPYLEQIFSKLKKGGLVRSVRGPGGGYTLSRDAEDIPVSDIVVAVEEPLKITRCEHGNGGCLSEKSRCLTHDLWEGLEMSIYGYLRSISLQDVCTRNVMSKMPLFNITPTATNQIRELNA